MENSKRPKIIVTDGYKADHKEFTDPANLENSFIIHDFGERGDIAMGSITEETKIIQKNLSKSLQVPNIIVSLQSNNQKD